MGTREAKKLDKRRRIEAAGMQAFLAQGFSAATVDQIVAGAGVARGTYYLYYADKDALLAVLLARVGDPLVAAVRAAFDALAGGAEPLSCYAALGQALAAALQANPDGARLLQQEQRSRGAGGTAARIYARALDALTCQILDDAVRRGLLRPHDTRAVALAITGGVERLTQAWLNPEDGDPLLAPEAVTAELIGLFTWGLAAGRA